MYPLIFRDRAVACHMNGILSLRRTCTAMGVAKSTLCRWMKQRPVRRAHRSTAALDAMIQAHLTQNPFATLEQLKRAVRHAASVSRTAVHQAVRRLGYSRKKAQRVVTYPTKEGDQDRFLEQMRGLPIEDLVSVDEAAVYVEDSPRYGYARRGTRLKVRMRRGSSQRRKVTLLLAIGVGGVLAWHTLPGAANGAEFAAFIESIPGLERKRVIMDNVSFHKTARVTNALRARGAEAFFIPPYSPECNPVEMAFSSIKSRYRVAWDATKTPADRITDLTDAILSVHGGLCHSWFQHTLQGPKDTV